MFSRSPWHDGSAEKKRADMLDNSSEFINLKVKVRQDSKPRRDRSQRAVSAWVKGEGGHKGLESSGHPYTVTLGCRILNNTLLQAVT